ncbi:MAG: hypothetical protein WA738_03915 [Candidatus Angelobacter sp.]
MKQPFFPELPRILRLRIYWARRQRAINRNLGLIIALLASAAAVWSGNEAHMARLDALDAMRLLQRPYVSVLSGAWNNDGVDGQAVSVRLKNYGATPAVFEQSAMKVWAGKRQDISARPHFVNFANNLSALEKDEAGKLDATCTHCSQWFGDDFAAAMLLEYKDIFNLHHCVRWGWENGLILGDDEVKAILSAGNTDLDNEGCPTSAKNP